MQTWFNELALVLFSFYEFLYTVKVDVTYLNSFYKPPRVEGVGEGAIFQPQVREGIRVIFLAVKGLGTRRQYAMIVTRM